MNRLERVLQQAAEELDRLGACWALVGGLAVSARTEPRFTRDVDLAVAVADDAEAEALSVALSTAGYRIVTSIEQQAADRLATVRFQPGSEPAGGVVLDLLFASSGIEAEIVAFAERLELTSQLRVPVARTSDLIALKLLAEDDSRPQDQIDLVALVSVADDETVAAALRSVVLITERGFARGRDLVEALERTLAPAGRSSQSPPSDSNR